MEDKRKKLRWQLPFLALLIVGTVIILSKQDRSPYRTNEGFVFGTVYKITYQYAEDLHSQIKEELGKVNASLSPFSKGSVISRINENDSMVRPDSMFLHVFRLAKAIAADTHGAFDITVAPIVNAWGFGFEQSGGVDSLTIDSLLQYVGMAHVFYDGECIIKADSCVKLDCSAIAKGYGCDVVAALFDRCGVRNYMVEIGGEIVVKGMNPKRSQWSIGINKPIDDSSVLPYVIVTLVIIVIVAAFVIFAIKRNNYPELLKAGVRIYEYSPGFIHSKLLIADGKTAFCGTVNFDYRSLVHHFECGALFYEHPVIASIKDDFEKTKKNGFYLQWINKKSQFIQKRRQNHK